MSSPDHAPEELPVPGSPQWWRARMRGDHERNRRQRANGITGARIAEATVAIIKAEGLDAVTMRRVATELGTGAASLYRHFASREELLVVVTDELLGQIRFVPPPGDEWRPRAEAYAAAFRQALLAHPALAQLMATGQALGPNSLRAREIVLGGLLASGFPPPLAVRSYLTITHYVISTVQLDDRSTKRDPRDRAELQALFRDLDEGTFPTVHALADELGGMHPDDEFEFGLMIMLDGITAQLAQAKKKVRRSAS
jgi:AcrR family transcriptional regulator